MESKLVKPADGKLGVLCVGLGAVSTTFIVGTLMCRKGMGLPGGSITQMAKIRVGRGQEKQYKKIGEIVPLADLKDLEIGAWDIFTDTAYESALHAEVLKPHDIEPVKDAKTLQPVKLTPGRGTQFWLTVHVPQDAKSGLYTSRVQTRCDGKDTGTFDITLRVYPFELPRAKTAYDLNEDYITFIIGVNLGVYAGMTKDLDEAARILKMDYANMAAHNIHHPGVAVFDGSKRSEEVF